MNNINQNNNTRPLPESTISKLPTWRDLARDNQKLPEGDWFLWMILAGRGFGKTRTGAESVMQLVESGKYKRIAIIGKTVQEVRDIMVEGQSGLLSTCYTSDSPEMYDEDGDLQQRKDVRFYPSKKKIIWKNGARGYVIGADNYESLRGLQFDLVWVDEFAKFKNPSAVWDQILFTLRLGSDPKCIMTTTPKPIPILKELLEKPTTNLTNGSTFENSGNLSARFIETMEATFVNTSTGDQELFGKLLFEKQNTVWNKDSIQYKSVQRNDMQRVVIGVDPSVSCSESSDETGIIVAGLGEDDNMYVLEDLSGKYTPQEWARVVCDAYSTYGASKIVAETNNGGDLVKAMLTTIRPNIPFKSMKAIKGKVARAEPISLLYESKKVFHAKRFKELEGQMCDLSYNEKPKVSPDRVDALVWALNDVKEKNDYHISCI